MYIKSITIDGFKTYGNRVEITGFDPAFNAITGLNGTGKSNILDAIVFVLGITNLSNVRAHNLVDLIYKQGHAGITKATVSITFDNRDRNQAPIGYENADEITITRQIAMGGKNKYMINGINVQNKRVSDLFCSVQLNVNNPHFLIMQGRITKVLNMKPIEILSMVEEAAGTSMYEKKRKASLDVLAKKDAKLAELDTIIRSEIAPKLQQVQDDRQQFLEHQKVIREMDGVHKLHKAYQYAYMLSRCAELENQIQAGEKETRASEALIKDNEKECKTIEKQIAKERKKLDAESSGVLKEMEQLLVVAEGQKAAATDELSAADASVAACVDGLSLAQRTLQGDQAVLAAKQAQADQMAESSSGLQAACESSEAALALAEERFAAARAGRGDGVRGNAREQLAAALSEAAELRTRIAGAALDLADLEERLQRLRAESVASARAYAKDQADVAERKRRHQDLQSKLSAISFDAARLEALEAERRALRDAISSRQDKVHAMKARLHSVRYNYTPPYPNFDAGKVLGRMATLIGESDPKFYRALGKAAGVKLFNVLVDTDETAQQLIQKNPQERVTFIPLNKIRPTVISSNIVAAALRIGGGADAVQRALDLVSCSEAIAPAIRFLFGNTLVCRDVRMAERVCFHPQVLRRCVTLDGDMYNPSGSMSGGAADRQVPVLQQLAELAAAERQLKEDERRLQAVDADHRLLQREGESYYALKRQLESVTLELSRVEERMAASTHGQAQAAIESLEAQISETKSGLQRDEEAQQEVAARVEQLRASVQDGEGYQQRENKNAEAALKKARSERDKHGAAWRARAGEAETLQLQVQQQQASVAAGEGAVAAAVAALAAAHEQQARARAAHLAAVAELESVKERLTRHNDEVAQRSGAISELVARLQALRTASQEDEERRRQRDQALTQLREELRDLASTQASLAAAETWIETEQQFFGRPGSVYDFVALKAHEAPARLEELTLKRNRLAMGLNMRSYSLHSKEEEQYALLLKRKETVEGDRKKLKSTISSLDETKRGVLKKAAAQVSKDFGSIFSTLLPGVSGRLEPPAGRDLSEGLEVRVAFNGVWQKSLSELSGGQRSLVALALVLAMLRYKPAPLYILDEVDAALDLSHTQNIGLMLRNHFQTSQFIIVSLKDGMFNNANVLFRTSLQDGMSSVRRTVNAAGDGRARELGRGREPMRGRGPERGPARKRGRGAPTP